MYARKSETKTAKSKRSKPMETKKPGIIEQVTSAFKRKFAKSY